MGIELGGWGGGAAVMAAKTCDACTSATAVIYCRADWVFLCLNCDSKIHSNHERVWMCEVCEQAPAVVTCKADAAALCVTCDADIHSANPLARRHERVPVEPFFDSADSIVKSSPFSFLVPATDHDGTNCKQEMEETDKIKTGDSFFSELDPLIEFGYQNSPQQLHIVAMDSVVPVQTKPATIPLIGDRNCFEIDFNRGSKLPAFSYQTQSSLGHSVSYSSLEVGIVPTMADPNVPISSTPTTNQASQVGGIDRKARVLRYREKRKNRKFEKTIRYASRKAYAESRPRIKGRFVKRTETDNNIVLDHTLHSPTSVFAAAFMAETEYGIVPSF
ncbi:B-box domain protein 6, CONSTANS-like 5 [Hibiscus trionum]|uniref:B-box domain protein 6, CONSTANS-like 5 n=1 Tax=Hibiscus trionum TaxID=183268 RepID=A0A9W7LSX9_HIBTR|nr:B-box domain protein 6, CONSTANS-like 5 [Hibiscus trionum]